MYKYRISKTISLDQFLNEHYARTQEIKEKFIKVYNMPIVYEAEEQLEIDKNPYTIISITVEDSQLEIYVKTLELVETDLPENMIWGRDRTRRVYMDNDYLIEQLRTRYAFLSRPTSGLSNIIIDNYAPKLMYQTRFKMSEVQNLNLPKTIYAINPWFAQYFGAQQIPTEQLCRILGYSAKDLKNLIIRAKRNDYSITFVGYGGTNVNTIHWLTEIMKLTQQVNLFKFIEIYENDSAEVSNLLRFPKNPFISRSNFGASKLALLEPAELNLLSRTKPEIQRNRITGTSLPYRSRGTFYDYSNRKTTPKAKHIYYGAPDINTRNQFSEPGHFISATHSGNTASLWLNPTQDVDLQVESYGLIELTPFFMNQLRLAIGLLEILAEGTIDLEAKDQHILDFSFDGTSVLSTNKVYNFQLNQHNGNVATEAEAAAIF